MAYPQLKSDLVYDLQLILARKYGSIRIAQSRSFIDERNNQTAILLQIWPKKGEPGKSFCIQVWDTDFDYLQEDGNERSEERKATRC